jgi:aminoglycoside phosphotransferase (APT) family kinase protein
MADWRRVLERAQSATPDRSTVERVIADVVPGRPVTDVTRLHGGLGAVLHRIDLEQESGVPEAMVLRQLMPEWGETAQHLEREAATLDRLSRSRSVPVPRLYWSDPSGAVFGRPAMLIEFMTGNCLIADLSSNRAIRSLAETLAAIHAAPVWMEHLKRLDSVADHLEILGLEPQPSDVVDANRLRQSLRAAAPVGRSIRPCLTHGDFHGGNVLWDGRVVTAVLDWPLATLADRWWDEAYAYMDTWLAHGEATATTFRSVYRDLVGDAPDPELQRFWDLSALVRALPSPDQWLDSYRHAGVTHLTRAAINTRYAEMVARAV